MKPRLGDVVKIISVDRCDDPNIIRTKGKAGRVMEIDGDGAGAEAYFVEFVPNGAGHWYSAEDLEIVDGYSDKDLLETSIADLDKCESVAKLINEVKGLSMRVLMLEGLHAPSHQKFLTDRVKDLEISVAELKRKDL